MQVPLIALLTPSPLRGELACHSNSGSTQTAETSVSNEVIEAYETQTLIYSAEAYKVLATTTITVVSVCLFSWGTGVLFMEGQLVAACCASLSLFLCFLNNLFLKVITVLQDNLFYRMLWRAIV